MIPLSIYRFSHWLYTARIPLLPRLLYVVNRIVFGLVLPPSAKLGRGVSLGYQGLGIVIHTRAVIGNHVTVGPGVVIGGRSKLDGVPIIGDDVFIGAGAKILGPIRVGSGSQIGANAVVITNVPEGCIAVGVPAKILRKH